MGIFFFRVNMIVILFDIREKILLVVSLRYLGFDEIGFSFCFIYYRKLWVR